MHSEEAIYVYEKILSGEVKAFSPYFFAPGKRKERIVTILRHIIENKLDMSPEQSINLLTLPMLKKYRADALVKHICPGGIVSDADACIKVIKYVYPQLPVPSNEDLAVSIYKDVLEGKRNSFPKRYFGEGVLGEKRAIACLRYLCLNILKLDENHVLEYFKSLKFSEAEQLLRNYKLWIATETLYLSVLSFVETAFPDKEVVLF